MTQLLDNSPMTHTMTPPTIDTTELVAHGLSAAVTLTVIPEVTLTLSGDGVGLNMSFLYTKSFERESVSALRQKDS